MIKKMKMNLMIAVETPNHWARKTPKIFSSYATVIIISKIARRTSKEKTVH